MIQGSVDVAEAALAAGVERFVYVSSIAALYAGPDGGTPVLEDSHPDRPPARGARDLQPRQDGGRAPRCSTSTAGAACRWSSSAPAWCWARARRSSTAASASGRATTTASAGAWATIRCRWWTWTTWPTPSSRLAAPRRARPGRPGAQPLLAGRRSPPREIVAEMRRATGPRPPLPSAPPLAQPDDGDRQVGRQEGRPPAGRDLPLLPGPEDPVAGADVQLPPRPRGPGLAAGGGPGGVPEPDGVGSFHAQEDVTPPSPHLLHVFSNFVPTGPELRTVAPDRRLRRRIPPLDPLHGRPHRGRRAPAGRRGGAAAAQPAARPARSPPPGGSAGCWPRSSPTSCSPTTGGRSTCCSPPAAPASGRLIHHEEGFNEDEAESFKLRRVLARRLVLPGAHRLVVPSQRLRAIATGLWKLPAGAGPADPQRHPPRPLPSRRTATRACAPGWASRRARRWWARWGACGR